MFAGMRPVTCHKLRYYSRAVLDSLVPRFVFQHRLPSELARIVAYDAREIIRRVDYCNKLSRPFTLAPGTGDYRRLAREGFWLTRKWAIWRAKHGCPAPRPRAGSAYYIDFKQYARYFPAHYRFDYRFGDVTEVPPQPAFVKSRPIHAQNENSVLLRLGAVRHFAFVPDPLAFHEKRDGAVFRGPCHQPHRQAFVARCHGLPRTDIGDTRPSARSSPAGRPFMSVADQLRYKFIISVEGNDVATNLKWIMASNSLCFMTRPRYETWFMEGTLIPGQHYVLLRDDYADLSERIDYYIEHPDEALAIIAQAQRHAAQFRDLRREKLISLLVFQKYFELSGQGPQSAHRTAAADGGASGP
jgi:hypothetical protein